MSVNFFGCILLVGVSILTAYLVSVSTVEPPLEDYKRSTVGEEGSPNAEGSFPKREQ